VDAWAQLEREVTGCRACPRLVEWREQVAEEKVARFRDWDYWGRPVPGFGDRRAHLLIVGLAPAAHGANRTGRVFTGDRSGDFLFASLWRTGYANQPTSVHADDGLALTGCFVTATVKCAPPANKPTPAERDACKPFLDRELELLGDVRSIVALGQFGWDAVVRHFGVRPKPRFAHGAEVPLPGGRTLIGSYHVSQQNTFTGVLTDDMLDAVFARARDLAAAAPG
jgi:uracil-DNA glycosylase family 4